MKNINISLEGTSHDYPSSLIPLVIKHLGFNINWVSPNKAHLRILGPFQQSSKSLRLIPKPLRPLYTSTKNIIIRKDLNTQSLALFHTQENTRYNSIKADYAISHDLGVKDSNHFRLPYWMEMIDWSHEGIIGNTNPRYGRLLSLDKLMQPLGNGFISRPYKAAFITSHLNEPRKLLYEQLQKLLPVDGYGPYFDKSITNHHTSSFSKYAVLQKYTFNLCPENSLYPGYITEKIPEAFYAGCIPITWVDPNVEYDFNPLAMINLMPMVHQEFKPFIEFLKQPQSLEQFADQALMIKKPSLEPCKQFLQEILQQVSS
jgi:Glycosyltransferase family 10 (fucosyltransferase) C-term